VTDLWRAYVLAWRYFAVLARDPEANPNAAGLRNYMRERMVAELEAAQ
jgi:hypothetical protein